MADKTLRGDAVAIAQVTRITAPTIAGPVKLTINDKTLSFASWVIATIVATWNAETDPVDPVAQTEEFSDITASADGNNLILTADDPGKPFIVTAGFGGSGTSNEVQTVTIGNSPTGGTFTLTFGANTTSGLAYNASASAVQAALEALASIGAGNVVVSGPNGGPYLVTFQGSLAATNVALMTASAASLTGGTAAIVITPLADGQAPVNEQQRISLNGTPTGGTFTLSFNGQTTGTIAYNASAGTVQTALQALSTIGSGNVSCSGGNLPGTPVVVTFQGTLAGVDVPLMTSNPASLTGGTLSGSVSTTTAGAAGNNLIEQISLTSIGGGVSTVNYFNGTTLESAAINSATPQATHIQSQLETLPSIGVGNVVVTDIGPSGVGYGVFTIQFQGALKGTNPTTSRIMAGYLYFIDGGVTRTPAVNQVPTGGTNEVQQVSIAGSPTSGTFKLTYSAQTTAPIPYNASAADVAAALNALSNINGGVIASGGALPGSAVNVTFVAKGLQETDVAQMTINVDNLKAAVELVATGVAGRSEVQSVQVTGNPFGGTFTLTVGANTTSGLAYNASAGTIQTALTGLASVGGGNCVCTGGPVNVAPVYCTFAASLANLATMPAGNSLNNGTVGVAETIPGGVTIVVAETTASRGPNHWDDPGNWFPYGVPETGDIVHLESGAASLLYGLRQRATFTANATTDVITLSTGRKTFAEGQKVRLLNAGGGLPGGLAAGTDYYCLNVGAGGDGFMQLSATRGGAAVNITTAGTGTHTVEVLLSELQAVLRYTGLLGLPTHTNDDNREYRPTALELGITLLTIGIGQGSGSGRMKIDTGAQACAVKVYDTGGSVDSEAPSLQWRGTNSGNTLQFLQGDMGIALLAGETAALASIVQRGGTLELGDGLTVTGPIDKTGGLLYSRNAALNGDLQLTG